jgi:hypothetical protein
MRKALAAAVGAAAVLGTAVPAEASMFEVYIRGHGGYEFLDLTAISAGSLMNLDTADYEQIVAENPDAEVLLEEATQEYGGSGYAVGGQAGVVLLGFLDLGFDFRQAGLQFAFTDADLTQLAVQTGFHFLGTEMIVDPSLNLGFGWCYLTSNIPGIAAGDTGTEVVEGLERTANGFIGRVGASLDVRFVSWMSVGFAADFSFLYFDASAEHTSWGLNTDVLGRLSFHI